MRFLADAGISPRTVEFLRSRGHDAVHVRERAERADSVNRRLEAVLAEQAGVLEAGALILVEDTRYRVRRLPIRP
jgi:hypothetical protein